MVVWKGDDRCIYRKTGAIELHIYSMPIPATRGNVKELWCFSVSKTQIWVHGFI